MTDVQIILRRGEAAAKCSIRPLRGLPGLSFTAYPFRRGPPDLSGGILLAPDAPPLTAADAGRPLILLDASWRHAARMRNAIGAVAAVRAIPPGWKTAYPRTAKQYTDPPAGLATVEALFAALYALGERRDDLLQFYPWRETFLLLNGLAPDACGAPQKPL